MYESHDENSMLMRSDCESRLHETCHNCEVFLWCYFERNMTSSHDFQPPVARNLPSEHIALGEDNGRVEIAKFVSASIGFCNRVSVLALKWQIYLQN